MKTKIQLYMSLISLTVTSFLLVVICCAWYVSNTEVSAGGIFATTKDDEINKFNIKLYNLTIENDYYIKGKETNIMPSYNNLDNTITAVLLEIEYQVNDFNNYQITINNNTNYSIYNNSLDNSFHTGFSNTIEIFNTTIINNKYLKNGSFTFYNNINGIKTNNYKLFHSYIDDNNTNYIYYIIDFNEELIMNLYDLLLSQFSDKADLSTSIEITNDISLKMEMRDNL